MKAVVVEKPGVLRVRHVAEQKIDDYQALVRTLACSICNGTDRKILDGTIPFFGREAYPGILGHESVGRVVKVGRKVTSFKEGDLVFRTMADVDGINMFWGGFAEFGAVTDSKALQADGAKLSNRSVHPGQQVLPGEMDVIEATVCITLKEVLSFLRALPVKKGDSLLVLGYGPVGLSMAYLAKMIGVGPVIVAGRRDDGLRQARNFGADETVNLASESLEQKVKSAVKNGVDFVVDAIGKAELVEEAAKALRPEGRIGTYAVVDRGDAAINRDKLKNVVPAGPDESKAHDEIMKLWQDGRIQPDRFVSHVMPMSDVQTGFDLIQQKQALKVVLNVTT